MGLISFLKEIADVVKNQNGSTGDVYNYVYSKHYSVLFGFIDNMENKIKVDSVVSDNQKKELLARCSKVSPVNEEEIENVCSTMNIKFKKCDDNSFTLCINKKSNTLESKDGN